MSAIGVHATRCDGLNERIKEAERALASHQRQVSLRLARVGHTLRARLTSGPALLMAAAGGYLVGRASDTPRQDEATSRASYRSDQNAPAGGRLVELLNALALIRTVTLSVVALRQALGSYAEEAVHNPSTSAREEAVSSAPSAAAGAG